MEMSSLRVFLFIAATSMTVHFVESMVGMDLVFREMGVELPPMPPSMPQSLREHLYPQERQRKQMMLQRQQRQREAMIRTLKHQREQQLLLLQAQAASRPKNPYSIHYSKSSANSPEKANIIGSAANAIPGSIPNAVGSKTPVNPYSVSRQGTSMSASINPYLTIRTMKPVGVPPIRPAAVLKTIKLMRDQPKRVREASTAGCRTPFENPAASAMFMGTCNSRSAKLVCQSMMMTCNDVGMAAMCCPFGVNKLTIDTMNYMQKMKTYMAEMM